MNTWSGEKVMGQAKVIAVRPLGINHAQVVPLVGTATAISTRAAGPGLVDQAGAVVVVVEVAVGPVAVRTTRGREF